MDCQGKTTVIGEGSNGKRRSVGEGVKEKATAFTRTKSEDARGSGGAGGACSAGLSVLASAGWSGFGPPTCPCERPKGRGSGAKFGPGVGGTKAGGSLIEPPWGQARWLGFQTLSDKGCFSVATAPSPLLILIIG